MKFNFFNKQRLNEKANSNKTATETVDYSTNDTDYKFIFNDPSNNEIKCEMISIGDLTKLGISDTLSIYKNNKLKTKLDFRYPYACSYKKEAIKFQKFVAIGISGFFYLYDLSTETVKLFIDFDGYFDGFTLAEDHLLVAYNSGIYCLTKYGQIKWHNTDVGLDGLIIIKVENGKIYGTEQIDPPDGWADFILDFDTGGIEK